MKFVVWTGTTANQSDDVLKTCTSHQCSPENVQMMSSKDAVNTDKQCVKSKKCRCLLRRCVSISWFHLKWTKNFESFLGYPLFINTHLRDTDSQTSKRANASNTEHLHLITEPLEFSAFIRTCWPGSKSNQNHVLPFPVFSLYSASVGPCQRRENTLRGAGWPLSLVKMKTAALHEHHTPKSVLTYASHDTEAWAFQVRCQFCFSIEAHHFTGCLTCKSIFMFRALKLFLQCGWVFFT